MVPSGGISVHRHTKPDHHSQSPATLVPKPAPHASEGELQIGFNHMPVPLQVYIDKTMGLFVFY